MWWGCTRLEVLAPQALVKGQRLVELLHERVRGTREAAAPELLCLGAGPHRSLRALLRRWLRRVLKDPLLARMQSAPAHVGYRIQAARMAEADVIDAGAPLLLAPAVHVVRTRDATPRLCRLRKACKRIVKSVAAEARTSLHHASLQASSHAIFWQLGLRRDVLA